MTTSKGPAKRRRALPQDQMSQCDLDDLVRADRRSRLRGAEETESVLENPNIAEHHEAVDIVQL